MSALWVILNDDKTEVIEVFTSEDSNSQPFQEKFKKHKAGTVFCRRAETYSVRVNWYYSMHVWHDVTRWGYGEPDLITWSACYIIPEIIKMLEIVSQ
jgi:hypothetical protein